MRDAQSPPDGVEQLFGALAAEPVPVPPIGRVLDRGLQRRRRSRIAAAMAVAAAILACVPVIASLSHATSRARQTSAASHPRGKSGHVSPATPAGRGALILGTNASRQLVMTRIGGTARAITIPRTWVIAQVATDPGGGWVIAYYPGSATTPGTASTHLATVSVSGRIRPSGLAVGKGWVVTGLAASPDGSAVAFAGWEITVNRLPGEIGTVPLPGHGGSRRVWTLSSAQATQAWSLSWKDDTHLTYLPGSDATGGGFAAQGAVTLDTARPGKFAPAVSRWPVFEKKAGQCTLDSGTWLVSARTFLALTGCNGSEYLGPANVTTGAAAGARVKVPGWGCANGQPLDPDPDGEHVLISFCGEYVDSGGHITAVPGIAQDAAWAG